MAATKHACGWEMDKQGGVRWKAQIKKTKYNWWVLDLTLLWYHGVHVTPLSLTRFVETVMNTDTTFHPFFFVRPS
jgi:hypothetical protein